MKVYAVLKCVMYEGEELMAVYDSREKAEEAAKKYDVCGRGDWIEVVEYELNGERVGERA